MQFFTSTYGKTVECYVDDIAVKSRAKSNYIADLKTVYDIMQAHQFKMNPTKILLRDTQRQIPKVCCHIQRNPP